MNTLNIYPETSTLSSALSALLVDYTWKSFTIIYENDEGIKALSFFCIKCFLKDFLLDF